ncbi:diacylglycerol kinase family lipid kinase [Rothia nasimurium]|uniref:Diacylglycerol kinase family lipid kinase n=1 Tax=Rothia nasimurium TaxID=85336 RepID=A0A4Y9F4V4_9MICC|nr:diacylglycerol kinase family lipid kinase [Rothia nasimurium]
MVSRSTVVSSLAVSAALAGVGAVFAVRRGRRARPDLFPVYRPFHRRVEPGEPRQVAVVYNPSKARAESVNRIITAELGFANWPKARFYETEVSDPGFGMTRQAVTDGAEIVLAVGGDGTVRAVADGLAGSGVPLGVVPLGTGNLLARNLEMNVEDLHACINVALHGELRAVDMIHMTMTSSKNLPAVNYLVMGGAGFDAQIMTDTREDLKAKIGWLAYVEASMKHMFTRRRPAEISVDGSEVIKRKIRTVLVANCGKIQGGVNLASVAELSDGQLEVIVLTPRNVLSWVRMAGQFILRRPNVPFPVVEHFVGMDVRVVFPHAHLPVEVDGDVLGDVTGLHAQVHPGAVVVNVYPDDMQIRSLGDLMDAREDIAEQQRRWWQRFLRL